MKFLIIGGAGYIGSHVSHELIDDGHDVAIFDNFSTGRLRALPQGARCYYGDILNEHDIQGAFQAEEERGHIDCVMHFAAKLSVEESVRKPDIYYLNNVGGTARIIHALHTFNIKNFVFSSTAAVYGESTAECVDENSPCMPVNPYGASKRASEQLIFSACSSYGIHALCLRYFNVAGAHERYDLGLINNNITLLIPRAVEAALGLRDHIAVFGTDYPTPDKTCIRDYIHVCDLAHAHILAAHYLMEGHESKAINLGSHRGYSVLQVLNTLNDFIPCTYVIQDRRAGDPAKLIASNALAQSTLGWQPRYGLRDMIHTDLEFRRRHLKHYNEFAAYTENFETLSNSCCVIMPH